MKLQSKINRLAQEGGFTLIEMLIVVAIIGILVAIAVPALNTAKSDAQTQKKNTITTSVATAKYRAFLKGSVTAGGTAAFTEFKDYLMINGVIPTLTSVVDKTNNGAGSNITTWGTYPTTSGAETGITWVVTGTAAITN